MHFLYNLGIIILAISIRLASMRMPKAKKWIAGRRNWRNRYSNTIPPTNAKTLWMHVSSLGEFEQGRPVLELFHKDFPDWRVILTFFSPSGYEIRKDYPLVDEVLYLPVDTPANARDFLELIQPDAAIFVKYDFWANYLFELKKRSIPTLLISGLFRPSQPFFHWYGTFWRKIIHCFTHVFVQDENSKKLLQKIGFQRVSQAGDTRVDRVLRLAAAVTRHPLVEAFVGKSPVIVAGSTWEADEQVLLPILQAVEFQHIKIIVAPHEPSKRNVNRLINQTAGAVPYSQLTLENAGHHRVLVIDNIGLLNSLYRYGSIAYIGGGFGKAIHNTLEPAAFGLPILFGPKFEKFEEARQFVALGGAFPIRNAHDIIQVVGKLQVPENYQKASHCVLSYLEANQGASMKAIDWVKSQFTPPYTYQY
jgi:3-deoxy-D-manno-octulosonic-acid transferase